MKNHKTQHVTGLFPELEKFPQKTPEYFNFGYDIVDEWAKYDRNKLAMIWTNQQGEEKRFTFHELSRLSNQAMNLLLKLGIRKGDFVFLMLPRVPEWWIFSLAMIKLGAIQCPSPTLLTAQDLKYRIQVGRFKLVITNEENAYKFDEIYEDCPSLQTLLMTDGERENWTSYRKEISPPHYISHKHLETAFRTESKTEEPFLVLFTSGTSKHPKMVLHNHSYSLGHLLTAKLWHGVGPNDLQLTISDTGWGKNIWGNYFGQWILGTCVLIYDIRTKFQAEELLPLMEKYGVTTFCAPPTVFRMLVLSDLTKYNLDDLRSCTAAGESLHTETIKLWEEGTGLSIREGYGQTETVCMIANFHGEKPRPGSMGKASPGWEIELHDDDGNQVKVGEDGRLALKISNDRPAGFFIHYLYAPEENEKSFCNGFYYTGDKARVDKNGYYWFVGRNDDIIKSAGYRIGPLEVEEVMMQHPSVREVAVVGVTDPMRGAIVKAYVVLNDGFDATETLVQSLQLHVKELTAPYKYPREIEFLNALPKTFSGKIKRDILRTHAETGVITWKN